jgi:hypothetical protein
MHDAQLRKLLDHIFQTHEDGSGMDCESCQNQFECLTEKITNGAMLHDLWPEIEAHLACCPECNEVFQAMLSILRAEQDGALDT